MQNGRCWQQTLGGILIFDINALYLVYGLGFFTMGVAIIVQILQPSQLSFAKTLWLLAFFGILHAFSEWGYIFVPLQAAGHEELLVILSVLHLTLKASSFAFLLAFGIRQYTNKGQIYAGVPIVILLVWFAYFIYFLYKRSLAVWYVDSEIWERYLLCFPGALISGLGIWRRQAEVANWGLKINKNFRDAGIVLLMYSVVSGLMVPPGDFFPSNILNSQTFLLIFHIPVQVVRALLSLILSWFVVRILVVFRMEYTRNIEKIEALQWVCSERQRIANDIHDGAIQAIYGSGMLLERAAELVSIQPLRSKELIERVNARLNETIDSLRRYIHGLKSENFGQEEFKEKLLEVIDGFREACPQITITHKIKVPVWFALLPGGQEHVLFIVQEGLANATRHADCSQIEVEVLGDEREFDLQIRDNGHGNLDLKAGDHANASMLSGYGIRSMQHRAQQLSAQFLIEGTAKGTWVKLHLNRVVDLCDQA
ncbi:sensor histidine kinase [Paradesulfitobacterium aromaticivorans]